MKYWLLYFCTDLFNSQHYLCVRQFLRSDFIYFIHDSSSSHECAEPKWQYCYHPYCHYENSLAITSMFFNTRVSASVLLFCVYVVCIWSNIPISFLNWNLDARTVFLEIQPATSRSHQKPTKKTYNFSTSSFLSGLVYWNAWYRFQNLFQCAMKFSYLLSDNMWNLSHFSIFCRNITAKFTTLPMLFHHMKMCTNTDKVEKFCFLPTHLKYPVSVP